MPLPTNKKSLKVLLVEDNKLAQMIAVRTLEDAGCSVDKTEFGNQAIEMANTNKYDFILMDIGLPDDTDGFKVVFKIRKDSEKNKPTPIFALTAHIDDDYELRAKGVGMNDFLKKPISSEKVNEIIKKIENNKNVEN